jgi:hypothetical protein
MREGEEGWDEEVVWRGGGGKVVARESGVAIATSGEISYCMSVTSQHRAN